MIDFESRMTRQQKLMIKSLIRQIAKERRPTINQFCGYVYEQLKERGEVG